jgi:hypothetical protein
MEALLLWLATVACWGYTTWGFYSSYVLRRHVHVYYWLLIVDIALPLLAAWMAYEWWRARRGS